MVLTKETQEAWVNQYAKTHTFDETIAFIEGIKKVIEAFERWEETRYSLR